MADSKSSAKGKKAPAAGSGKGRGAAQIHAEADKLIETPVARARIEEAVELLERRLEDEPKETASRWRIARAWVRLLESETGTVLEERKEYFPILDELGKKALASGERAHVLDPRDTDAIGWHMVSYGYYSVSIGIVRAVLQGAASKYLSLANELNGADETWFSAAGWRAQGRFYREAPWPKRDISRSIDCFRRAVELAAKRQENKLHLALALIDDSQSGEAADILAKVVKGKPEPTEAHFHKALVAFAKQKLEGL